MTTEIQIQRAEAKSADTPSLVRSTPLAKERRNAIATYLAALLLGLGLTAYTFPARKIFATDSLVHPVAGIDAAIHAVGQRYFVKSPWGWPPLLIKSLATPDGTNVAFTDSIPLLALLMKLLRGSLPPGFHSITLWLAICWVAQPIAAVFAFRSAGERRLLPNFAVALISVSMPTLLFRTGHAALCSHFLILIALGLYFRITRSASLAVLVGADALILVALLVNPYIMYMVIAVLAAAPLTLLIRKDPGWIRAVGSLAAGLGITAAIALLLGYGRALPMTGFGFYSMNVLSPIYPSTSMIIPSFDGPIDATGGQYEGYQYLGAGVILLLIIADFCLGRSERLTYLRRHSGLVLACVALFLLALSNKVYAGHHLLLNFPAPSWILQLRTTGRFFWPVAYTALIVSALIVCRILPRRFAVSILLLLAVVQYVESSPMRRWLRRGFRSDWDWAVNTAQVRPLLAHHSKLIVWPKYGCGGDQNTLVFSHLFLLASESAIPVNTTYTGRLTSVPTCDFPEFPISVKPNELWVFVPNATPAMEMSVADWHSICRQIGVLVTCAQDLRNRDDLPVPNLPVIYPGKVESTSGKGPGTEFLVSGWSYPEPWGIWAEGSTADLVADVSVSYNKPLMFRALARGLGVHPSTTQRVTVIANGRVAATWDVKEGENLEYSAPILPRSTPGHPIMIQFRVDHPVSPHQDGLSQDNRKLGFGLAGFRFDEQKTK